MTRQDDDESPPPERSSRASEQRRDDPATRRVVQVCNAAGAFIEYWGFKANQGRVWTLLALSSGPLSQSAIAEALEVSRSLVSTTISELIAYGLVRPTSEHRNAPYEAVMDIWPTISDVLRSREWMLLETTRLALEAALEEVELHAEGTWSESRMRTLLAMTEAAQSLLKLLIAIRVPRSLDALGDWVRHAANLLRAFLPGR